MGKGGGRGWWRGPDRILVTGIVQCLVGVGGSLEVVRWVHGVRWDRIVSRVDDILIVQVARQRVRTRCSKVLQAEVHAGRGLSHSCEVGWTTVDSCHPDRCTVRDRRMSLRSYFDKEEMLIWRVGGESRISQAESTEGCRGR